MRFTTYINNAKCMEWEINATQGILFSLLYEAPAWAKEEIIENKAYYFVSRNLILNELPMFFEKSDTVYRNLKVLQEKGLIEYIKQGKKDLIKITSKGKTWNEFKENNSEKNPNSEQNSEKNPSKFGKKSEKQENNSEKNPTNNNTIYNYNNTNILNNNIHVKNEFSQSCEKIKNQWIKIAYEFDLSGKQLKITDKRKRAINNLLKEYSLEEMLQAMGKIRTSNFLQGNNKTGWQISFDWFTNKSNFLKVLEGNYDDKAGINNSEKEKKSKNYQEKDFVGVTNESIANLLGGLTGNE
nr:MAG TPA: PaaX-like protein [Caudoviricetes sp.]